MSAAPVIAVGTTDGIWFPGTDQPTEFAGRNVAQLRSTNAVLWAVVDGRTVARRGPSGGWESIAEVADLRLNCVLPLGDGVLVGTSSAHLLEISGGVIERLQTFDAAPGRDQWFTPWGGAPDVRSIDADDDRIYVNVHVGGILRSDHQLESWDPTLDINADVHEIHVVPRRTDLLLAACSWGLAVSTNGGDSWSFLADGMHAHYCRAVVAVGDFALVTAALGPRGGQGAVYRCPLDKPEALEKCERGLPAWFDDNIDTGCVAARDELAVLGSADGRVFASEDAGATWSEVASGLPEIRGVALVNSQ
ncbi:MAG: WD40/YVTN/BNR-like repeat-containing protein [Actinomycetota bacterium]